MCGIVEKPFVVAVVGPTASGKTAFGIRLAKKFGGEVISADSMQIYSGMDIATAKPTEEEKDGIPHHLIGIIDIDAQSLVLKPHYQIFYTFFVCVLF